MLLSDLALQNPHVSKCALPMRHWQLLAAGMHLQARIVGCRSIFQQIFAEAEEFFHGTKGLMPNSDVAGLLQVLQK